MLSQIDVQKLFNMGAGYVQEIINDIDNPFWKDIYKKIGTILQFLGSRKC